MPVTPSATHEPIYEESWDPENGWARGDEQNHQYHDHDYEEPYPAQYASGEYDYQQDALPPSHTQSYVPPPETQAEEGLSEKERVRLAEERLLPSQPPDDLQSPSSSRTVIPPSMAPVPAPSASSAPPPDEPFGDLYSAEDAESQAMVDRPHPLHRPTAAQTTLHTPTAPNLSDLAAGASAHPTEDKQELERQRLLGEASAPSDFPEADENGNAGEGRSRSAQHEPSAPVLTDEDEYGGQYSHQEVPGSSAAQQESLPKYER